MGKAPVAMVDQLIGISISLTEWRVIRSNGRWRQCGGLYTPRIPRSPLNTLTTGVGTQSKMGHNVPTSSRDIPQLVRTNSSCVTGTTVFLPARTAGSRAEDVHWSRIWPMALGEPRGGERRTSGRQCGHARSSQLRSVAQPPSAALGDHTSCMRDGEQRRSGGV
jgi:hypothetical protein